MCKAQKEDFFKDREEAEMEMSDSEDNASDIPAKKSKKEESYNAMGKMMWWFIFVMFQARRYREEGGGGV